jgi:hypothetical protein
MAEERNGEGRLPIDKVVDDADLAREDVLPLDANEGEMEEDLAAERLYETKGGDGHTYDPFQAEDQGLTYTPPSDPPVVPSREDPQGAKVAAGFATSMEDAEVDVEDLPDRVDDADLDLQEDIGEALRYNSETRGLEDVRVYVSGGVVSLFGTVPGPDDVAQIYNVVHDLDGVVEVYSYLQVGQ